MNYYEEIKIQIINNEVTKRVKEHSKNRCDLNTYYNVGKLFAEAGKHYGDGIIKKYSIKLVGEVDKKYSVTTLKRMRQFYWMIEKGAPIVHQLTWSHYIEFLPLKDKNEILYYISISISQNLSRNELRVKIKNKEYERLDESTRLKLINKEDNKVSDFVKNPILIKNSYNYTEISEKVLQKLILEDIPSFLDELGTGFTFVKNEYRIKLGDRYNYIDLLLYNIEFNCYVVVELKVTELKKEHIGQVKMYMNYIDKNLKRIDQNKTIGIIIVRKANYFVMEYCSDDRVLSREYSFI